MSTVLTPRVKRGADFSITCFHPTTIHLNAVPGPLTPSRYGKPDPHMQRECDVKVALQMASVQYVHTQRFQSEVVAFIQHFTQLQDVLGRQRAAIEGQAVSTAPRVYRERLTDHALVIAHALRL